MFSGIHEEAGCCIEGSGGDLPGFRRKRFFVEFTLFLVESWTFRLRLLLAGFSRYLGIV